MLFTVEPPKEISEPFETGNHPKVEKTCRDQGRPACRLGVKKQLEWFIEHGDEAGGVQHPKAGKSEPNEEIKSAAKKMHGLMFQSDQLKEIRAGM